MGFVHLYEGIVGLQTFFKLIVLKYQDRNALETNRSDCGANDMVWKPARRAELRRVKQTTKVMQYQFEMMYHVSTLK